MSPDEEGRHEGPRRAVDSAHPAVVVATGGIGPGPAELARRDGRNNVGCIILGRGSNAQKVVEWLKTAANVPGFIGFAVGRTSFWDPLVALRDGKATRQQAVEDIASRYLEWVRVFDEGRAG